MTYRMLGMMSGTSLDGLDLCRCDLHVDDGHWNFDIIAAETLAYDAEWRSRLDAAIALPPDALAPLDRAYGDYLARAASAFLKGLGEDPAAVTVASHGHTVHHDPANAYTRQVGDPSAIAEELRCRVVGDFRRGDVALGGEGAPLVPLVDRVLFSRYTACVNLGGFANVSYEREGVRLASDVTVCNLLLNRLAGLAGLPYDDDGALATGGNADRGLLHELEADPFFRRSPPKSLGREWFERAVWPMFSRQLASGRLTVADGLATGVAHLSRQIASSLTMASAGEVLVTGGGAHNGALLAGLRQNLGPGLRIASVSRELVDFKEALAFACLGALRIRGETNVLASVTGARRDSCAGVIAEPTMT